MDKELVAILTAAVLALGLIMGSIVWTQKQKNDCVQLLKDKPALEIRVVC